MATNGQTMKMDPVVDVAALRSRWSMTMGTGLAAAFMVVASYAFAVGTFRWISLGIGAGIATVGLLLGGIGGVKPAARQNIELTRGLRVPAWYTLGGSLMALGAWNVVQSVVFSPATVRWIGFADGLAAAGIAALALLLHEISTERVVHSIEIAESQAARSEREPIGVSY